MNRVHLGRELRTSAGFLCLLAVALALVAGLLAGVFPSVQAQFQAMRHNVPSFLRPLIETRAGLNSFEAFVAVVYTHPVVLGLMSAWPLSRGARAVAGEIEDGTLGLALSYPISRLAFLVDKALVLWLGVAVLSLSMVGGFWLAFGLRAIDHAPLAAYLRAALPFGLLYGSLGMVALAVSARTDRRAPALGLGIGLMLGSFLLNYLAQLLSWLKPYQVLSLYHYANPKEILLGAPVSPWDVAVLLGVAGVAAGVAAVSFQRRDLSI